MKLKCGCVIEPTRAVQDEDLCPEGKRLRAEFNAVPTEEFRGSGGVNHPACVAWCKHFDEYNRAMDETEVEG